MSDKNLFQAITEGRASTEQPHGLNFLDLQKEGGYRNAFWSENAMHYGDGKTLLSGSGPTSIELREAAGAANAAEAHARSIIGELGESDIISANRHLSDIAKTVGAAEDASPAVTRSLSAVLKLMKPSNVTYENLGNMAWQSTTQGKLMELGRVLAADGWEAEAATVLRLMPK